MRVRHERLSTRRSCANLAIDSKTEWCDYPQVCRTVSHPAEQMIAYLISSCPSIFRYPECPSLVCHASLWSEDGTEERGVVLNPSVMGSRRHDAQQYSDNLPPNPANYIQVLVGLLVSPCHILADTDGQRALFFTVSLLAPGQLVGFWTTCSWRSYSTTYFRTSTCSSRI